MVQAEIFIFIEIVCAPFRHRNWLCFVVVVVVAGSCRFSVSASFVLHSSSYSDRNGTGGWARATLIIIKVAEIGRTRRHNVVRWRWLWWMLKTEKLSNFDIWHYANSSFPLCSLSLYVSFSATNAFVVRILPHWKWWLAHTSATANWYYYYYYFELLECIRRSRNKHIFLHRWNVETTKTIRDIYVECTEKKRHRKVYVNGIVERSEFNLLAPLRQLHQFFSWLPNAFPVAQHIDDKISCWLVQALHFFAVSTATTNLIHKLIYHRIAFSRMRTEKLLVLIPDKICNNFIFFPANDQFPLGRNAHELAARAPLFSVRRIFVLIAHSCGTKTGWGGKKRVHTIKSLPSTTPCGHVWVCVPKRQLQ